MAKSVLITGATDGLGLATARRLVEAGHHVLLHGRNPSKLADATNSVSSASGDARVSGYLADLSRMTEVEALAKEVTDKHTNLDVLINNAGVYSAGDLTTADGLDVRFAVNTIAPYALTQRLLPLIGPSGRVINLSSAAQAPVDLHALAGRVKLSGDGAAYAQSKLALTMWSRVLGLRFKDEGPAIIAVNPGSMLGTKMVKNAFGVAGADIGIGAEILTRAALADDFAAASGQYFDNDEGRFSSPHDDALDPEKSEQTVRAIEAVLADLQT
ncbi:SDR family NAD(P)-dependent oxidoreductase [Mycobacterium spongiae]|uniref:SDR family NAD(P)-dependent oxidoreductase n=1 Tax=Mycobacterium spongiae TaxID=886343 RepID=A0A975JU71_9MYCO|nr:SDR family NAD(P)-dependent oxidoreductase [Mycobacterium spongiae]QUR65782.1 SDR family NAD(P)-dependent oxidoreductase [Mycobacterium spongiae]